MYATLVRFVGLLVIIPVAIIGWCAAIHLLYISPLWKKPDWISAIGTLLAFGGTIWLARSADRRQQRSEQDRALIASASLLDRLAALKSAVDWCIGHLEDPRGLSQTSGPHPLLQLANTLTHVQLWTDEEILPLSVLPDRITARLAVIRSKVESSVRDMSAWMEPNIDVPSFNQSVTLQFLYNLRLVDESLKAVLAQVGPLAGELHVITP